MPLGRGTMSAISTEMLPLEINQTDEYASVPAEEDGVPVRRGTRNAPPIRGRACSWRRLLKICIVVICLYDGFILLYVNILSKSHASGYKKSEQHIGPLSLLLMPLIPWVRKDNRQETPAWSQELDHQQTENEDFVASMPVLEMAVHELDEESLHIHMGSELSGCDPKFIMIDKDNKYLFKPNKNKWKVWNELLAYLVNKIAGFERVPPVWPYEMLSEYAEQPKDKKWSLQSMPFVKCNFDLDEMNKWIRSGDKMIGTLQLMVDGVSKRSKLTNRARNKIGKWTDGRPKLSVFAQREISTRTVFDHIIGNYDRYNNDFIQTQSNGDKVLVYIDQGSFVGDHLLPPNMFEMTDYCRFYWNPIKTLREGNLRDQIVQELMANNKTRYWSQESLIDIYGHPTVVNMDVRVQKVLEVIDDCVTEYGHDYVFLEGA